MEASLLSCGLTPDGPVCMLQIKLCKNWSKQIPSLRNCNIGKQGTTDICSKVESMAQLLEVEVLWVGLRYWRWTALPAFLEAWSPESMNSYKGSFLDSSNLSFYHLSKTAVGLLCQRKMLSINKGLYIDLKIYLINISIKVSIKR